MKQSFLNKRIPTLLGLFLILIGIVGTTLATNSRQILQSNASGSSQPKDVRITNVSENSFTISYSTDSPVSGSINYGKDKNLGQSTLDNRDQKTGNLNNYNVHYFTIKNLSASTKYYFNIISGQETYTNNESNFEITTALPLIDNSSQQTFIKGKVRLENGQVPAETVVYVTASGSQVISSLTDEGGNFSIPLSSIRTNDLANFYSFDKNTVIKLLVSNESSSSNVILYYSQAENVPVVTLSENYDFRTNENQTASVSASIESFPSFKSTQSALLKKEPKILTPQSNQQFSQQQPLFKGTGLPKQNVQIIIHSNQAIQANVSTDNSGNWNYQPATALTPGNHTITIITKNASGVLQTITQSFVVYAAETTNATNSAQLSQTPTITPTPTQTIDTTTEASTSANANSQLPATGNPLILTLGIVGLFTSLIGGLLFLLTRGGI